MYRVSEPKDVSQTENSNISNQYRATTGVNTQRTTTRS